MNNNHPVTRETKHTFEENGEKVTVVYKETINLDTLTVEKAEAVRVEREPIKESASV
jgi:hypothetical protein